MRFFSKNVCKNWWEEGEQPDYRFSLANERTFLAWIRTSLALLAGSVGIYQLIQHYELPNKWICISISLALVGAIVSLFSWLRWRENEISMRNSKALKVIRIMPMLSLYVFLLSFSIILYMF